MKKNYSKENLIGLTLEEAEGMLNHLCPNYKREILKGKQTVTLEAKHNTVTIILNKNNFIEMVSIHD